jgi:2-alkyl-3-oxoalkanoate reductase
MKYLVTGATGFLGGRILKTLAAQGNSTRALVRPQSNLTSLPHSGVELVKGDLRDPTTLRAALTGVDIVLHCAATVGERGQPAEFRETNVHGTQNLVRTAGEVGVGRVVIFSSLSVFGIKDHNGTREDAPLAKCGDPYADSKVDEERVLGPFLGGTQPEVTILRPGIVYGPGDQKFVPKIAAAVRSGRFAFIGDGSGILNLIYVDDVVQVALLAATAPMATGRSYNLTDGSRTTLREFVNEVAVLCDAPAPTKSISVPVARIAAAVGEFRARFSGGEPKISRSAVMRLAASRYFDITRARKELGYEPKVMFRDGLRRTLIRSIDSTPAVAPSAAVERGTYA